MSKSDALGEQDALSEQDALAEQLVRLLDIRLVDPLEILLDGDDCVDRVRARLQRRALDWAFVIERGDEPEAVQTIARLLATLYPDDHAFTPPVEWWRTPLRQAVVRRVGHPFTESVSLAMAGAMLGISRQGVHDLVRRGKLPRHPDGGVPVSAVRERLLAGSADFTRPADFTQSAELARTADFVQPADFARPGDEIGIAGDFGHDHQAARDDAESAENPADGGSAANQEGQ